ncbi:MAG: EAL domain-containing protein, partial [Eubacterium sp.]|nr:EAL domain-containing protein [Eubacterium sp.]
ENRYYNQELFEDYFGLTGSNTSLTSGEKQWLEDHGKIRVGYKDNDLPFCAEDKTSGNLTGALKECLDLASSVGGETKVEFEPVSYPSTEEVLDALESGEVDTVFPIGISASDGEDNGIVMTRPLLNTEMYAVVRKSDHINVLPKKNFRVAINEGNPNLTVFVERNFPNWEIVPEKKEQDCLKAVESGEVDTTLLNRYRALRSDDLPQNEQLMTVVTGKSMPLSFAVRRSEGDLYAILGKAVSQISEAAVESAIEPYVYDYGKVSVMAFLRDHWIGVVIVLTAVFLLILFLLFQRLDAERRANERERLITATELDPLTKLYNRNFFFEYANKMYRDAPNREMDAVAVNVENFHSVNELNGREFGDRVLIALGDELKSIQEESKGIAGRFESDHFDLYCGHMEDYQALFDRLQERVDKIPGNATVRIRMGVMPWQKGVEPVQMFDRARTACSIARESYMATLIIFDEEIRQKEIYEQRILNDLRRALEEKEFLVYYQPKYYVQCETPMLSSAEALVRWKHPELGMISPGVFIPLLERNALIEKVDVFVWEEAARQVAAWKKKYGVTI